ncbi:alpha/beta fold hydrolase [Rhodococcus sp. WS4]|nr:alpha/beta fold hydrolase [Rhodococcus sp. WS4]
MDLPHDIAGSGPTLVLVHGIVHRRQAWNVLLEQLTPYRRVVTVDLPGHGESAALEDGADTMDHLLEELSAFVRSVTPAGERPHVAGNSLGGWLSLALAARGEVASATALSPAGFFVNRADQARTIYTFRALRGLTRALGSNAPRALGFRAVRYPSLAAFFARPSRVRYEDAVIDAHSLATNTLVDKGMTASFDLPHVVDATVPVTVAWGRRDLILPVYQARRVRRSFPQARILVLPGIGHVPMTDDPNLISTILLGGSSSSSAASPS